MKDESLEAKVLNFLMRPSTLEFYKEGRAVPGYSWFDFLHGYVYGRWPYLYIGIGKGDHWAARFIGPVIAFIGRMVPRSPREKALPSQQNAGFADNYHGKVVPLQAARQLVMVNEEICLTNLERVIPYARARDIVLKNPDHIMVLECPCRASRQDPCLPLDVCLVIGEPFASFVADHHPERSRRITAAEAAEILQAEDERGHVHHAFFKDAMLGRFYAICNCCACCCGAMNAQRNGTPMLASSGYTNTVDEDLCIGCGDCLDFCQFEALSLDTYTAAVNRDACMGCGICLSHCDQGALSLVRDPVRGEPLEIFELLNQAVQ